MTAILAAVRSAYAAGLCLLPVREDGSKAPDVSSWTTYQTTRPDAATMRGFAFKDRGGFGMVSGASSGRREAFDFDTAEVFDQFLEAAERSGLGALVARIRAGYEDTTPGGGRRWIVAYPDDATWRDCTLARRPGRPGEPTVKTLIEPRRSPSWRRPTAACIRPASRTST